MGFVDFVKSLKLREWLNIVFFIISLAMLIIGAVLLHISISMIPPDPTSIPKPNLIFTTSYAYNIPWNDDLNNPSSAAFQILAESIETNISKSLHFPKSEQLYDLNAPVYAQINAFTKGPDGVNFYSEFIFLSNSVTPNIVSAALTATGYPTNSFPLPTLQCAVLNPQHSNEKTTSVTTNPQKSTTKKPNQKGAYCSLTQKLLNVYLVDVSVPFIGTLDNKLKKVQDFLRTVPSTYNLELNENWSQTELRLVIYGGIEANQIGRAKNQKNWLNVVSKLNSTIVNPDYLDGHEVHEALQFVLNNFYQTTPEAVNLIFVSDGINLEYLQTSELLSSKLRNQFSYSIGSILISTSQVYQAAMSSITTDYYHFYPIDNIDYLSNEAVLQTQALWSCSAFYPTELPPTRQPTLIPLITTKTTVSPSYSTVIPSRPAAAICTQNVLFLIEQSQTMFLSGYSQAIELSKKIAAEIDSYNKNSTFGFIMYNTNVVFQMPSYGSLSIFNSLINTAPLNIGFSNIAVGFTAALNFIKTNSNYSLTSTSSNLYFLSDGLFSDINLNNATSATLTIRSTYKTNVIGINLAETNSSRTLIQKVIENNVYDGYQSSVYIGVQKPNDILTDVNLKKSVNSLKCKNTANCFIDLTFVIENSQIEGDNYVDIQRKSVLNIVNHYSSLISPFKISISFIHFSAQNTDQNVFSSILFQQSTDIQYIVNTLNFTSFSPYGGMSDLNLGFNLTEQSLKSAVIENKKIVVFFARGAYEKYSNCCKNPEYQASLVRKLATIQGVLIGLYPNKTKLDLLTGSNSINANQWINGADITSDVNRQSISLKISNALFPILDNFISNQNCPANADFINPPCENPIDSLIILHASQIDNWNLFVNFTTNQLIPDLLGTHNATSQRVITSNYPVNLGIIAYHGEIVDTIADFSYLQSTNDYVRALKNYDYVPSKTTQYLSEAYKEAISVFREGRAYASKNVIVITDTIDVSDQGAFSEHLSLVAEVGGVTSSLTFTSLSVPGTDFQQIVNSFDISDNDQYASRQLANVLTKQSCSYSPLTIPPTPPSSPSPTLPGPIPLVKARNVWPDITILIDTSTSINFSDVGMNSFSFEKIRRFLDIWLNKYSVGDKGSRFTLATFDGEEVDYSCKFFEVNNYYDLSLCRNEKLEFRNHNHNSVRNVSNALKDLRQNVYGSNSTGFRSLNENFLVILTLGLSSTSFSTERTLIERMGVRTISIGLTDTITYNQLSEFGQNAFKISDWNSSYTGIDTNYDLVDRMIQLTTNKRSPSTSTFYANIIFIVDQSQSIDNNLNAAQFVNNLAKPFLVDLLKTKIGVVPYANDVTNVLPLTGSSDDVDNYFNTWLNNPTGSSTNISNIGSAISFVSRILKNIEIDSGPVHIVFVVGSSLTIGSETAKQLLSSYNNYVISYNPNVSYASSLVSENSVVGVSTSNELLNVVTSLKNITENPVVTLRNQIFSKQQYLDSQHFSLSAMAADFVVLIDETGLNESEFANVKNFLINATTYFDIGPTASQLAIQSYNGHTIPHGGYHFYRSTNGRTVRKDIEKLQLIRAVENTTDADLAGAIEEELYYFLTEQNGWRQDRTTFTIILSHAETFYDRDTSIAENVKNLTFVYSVQTNNYNTSTYMKNFVNTGFIEHIDSASSLSIYHPVIQELAENIKNKYISLVYPSPVDVQKVIESDFVFLIDNQLQPYETETVRNFLRNFVQNVGDFFTNNNSSRISIINYNRTRSDLVWALSDDQDKISINDLINNLQISTSTGPSNLRSAIDYTINNEDIIGVNSTRLTYFIIIAKSENIKPSIDFRTSRKLNTKYSTFVIQVTYHPTPFNYVSSVVGTKLLNDRFISSQNLNVSYKPLDTFSLWISNEFSAWKTTFGKNTFT